MTQTPTTKCCTKCGIEYPATLEYFPKNGNGLNTKCRKCVNKRNREYRKKNREYVNKRQRERRNANRERFCSYTREYRKENNESFNAKRRNYREIIGGDVPLRPVYTTPESEDYSDLAPIPEDGGFRQWAVITSKEYGAVMRPSAPEEKEN